MGGGRVKTRRGREEEAEGCCQGGEGRHKLDDANRANSHTNWQGGKIGKWRKKRKDFKKKTRARVPSLPPSLLAPPSLPNTLRTQGIARQGHLHAALHALLLLGRARCVWIGWKEIKISILVG